MALTDEQEAALRADLDKAKGDLASLKAQAPVKAIQTGGDLADAVAKMNDRIASIEAKLGAATDVGADDPDDLLDL